MPNLQGITAAERIVQNMMLVLDNEDNKNEDNDNDYNDSEDNNHEDNDNDNDKKDNEDNDNEDNDNLQTMMLVLDGQMSRRNCWLVLASSNKRC